MARRAARAAGPHAKRAESIMNLIVLEPGDFVSEALVRLVDRRALHARSHLRAQVGDRVRVGLLDESEGPPAPNLGHGEVLRCDAEALELRVELGQRPPPSSSVTLALAAHANDLADPGEAVSVSASLLLLFSTGAIFGPIFAALLKQEFGHGIVFLYTAGIHVLVMLAILYRTTQRGRAPAEDRVSYEELPVSSTPAVFELASADAESDSEGDQAVDVEHGPPAKP
jgi:hypothetical protein